MLLSYSLTLFYILFIFSCVELNLGDKPTTPDGLSTQNDTSNDSNPFATNEAVPNEEELVCKPIDPSNVRVGESAAEQYWERFVLGINRAALGELTVNLNE